MGGGGAVLYENITALDPKKSRFPGPNPLPLELVMDLHGLKQYVRYGTV